MRLRVPFRAMAAEHEIVVDHDDPDGARTAVAAAIADVQRIEAKFSRYRDDSVTSAIARAAGGPPVAIDDETAALLAYADACHVLSGGAFDVTSGVLRRAWDFRARPPRLPSQDEIDALLPKVGWTRVERTPASVRLPEPGMELDFGGIGKEYAADRAAGVLAQHGIRHALVNLGGDLRAIGAQGGGRPWRIGIRNPRPVHGAPAAIAAVALADAALATSGDYERGFEIAGVRYAHILDARTGWPVSHWQSISVVAPLAVVAGSCATLAVLAGARAAAFLREQGVDWLGIDAGGTRHGTLG
ncbi:MAG TPA: FAD:protein FMN transferase [Casimicrobiaceae bacterium]|nr:FAD:protein FMN transferase [Casimicrobiaceae bacterium]